MEFGSRGENSIAIDLACLAPTSEGGGVYFYDVPLITQVDDLLVEPPTPLVLATISYTGFSENYGFFITCDAPKRCLANTPFEQVMSLGKERRGLLFDLYRVQAIVWQYTM